MVCRRGIGCKGTISETEAARLDPTDAEAESSTREAAR